MQWMPPQWMDQSITLIVSIIMPNLIVKLYTDESHVRPCLDFD